MADVEVILLWGEEKTASAKFCSYIWPLNLSPFIAVIFMNMEMLGKQVKKQYGTTLMRRILSFLMGSM